MRKGGTADQTRMMIDEHLKISGELVFGLSGQYVGPGTWWNSRILDFWSDFEYECGLITNTAL
jgi:hypothetical protein